MGGTPPPFTANSAKIINLIFEPFPYIASYNIGKTTWITTPLHKPTEPWQGGKRSI